MSGPLRWKMALTLMVTLLIAYYDRLNVSLALPLIAADFGWDAAETRRWGGILMSLFYVGYGLGNIFLSPFGQRFGLRRSLFVIVVLWSFFTALGAWASSILMLFAASRLLLGLSEGIHFPLMSQLTKNWFPPEERSRGNGIWIAGLFLAFLTAPLFLVPLMHWLGWRGGFYALAVIGLAVSLPLVWRYVHDQPAEHPRIEDNEREFIEEAARLELSQVHGGAGRLRESLLTGPFLLLALIGIFNNMVALGIAGWLPTYLAGREGVAFHHLTWLTSIPYASAIVGIVIWASLGDRTNMRAGIAGVCYFLAGGLIWLALVAPAVWVTVAFFAAAVMMISAWSASEFALVQRILPQPHVTAGCGIYNGLTTLIGGGSGPFVVGRIIDGGTSLAAVGPIVVITTLNALLLFFVYHLIRY
ncbi:MAG: MFS transporter [Wenzhouxiangellaceae bacterium]|nr:MAG: MFS transporter [Wenzhouxiangellaceae bacterium]